MRISDWSSDVCSSDLIGKAEAVLLGEGLHVLVGILRIGGGVVGVYAGDSDAELLQFPRLCRQPPGDGAHVGAVVAEVDDERALRTRDLAEAVRLAVGAEQGEVDGLPAEVARSEEHTSELQSLMRISY